MKKLLLVLLLVPLISFGQSDLEKYDSALFFINMIREHQQLKPLELDEKLNKLAQSRVDELAFKGFYIESEDETGEIFLYTDREKPYDNDYFLHASSAVIKVWFQKIRLRYPETKGNHCTHFLDP